VPETGLVTVFCPLTTTSAVKTLVQTAKFKFVVDCKAKPGALDGHDKTTLASERVIASCGAATGPSEILNSVPLPELPPLLAPPKRVLVDTINSANGPAPSLLVERGPEVPVKL